MSIRPILRFPDPRLKAPAARIETFDAGLSALADDLLDTMRAAPGIGITAPHIGILLALTVIEPDASSGVRIYVNPQIVRASTDEIRHLEGSVSMPGVTEEVVRAQSVTVRYQTLEGVWLEEDAEGWRRSACSTRSTS